MKRLAFLTIFLTTSSLFAQNGETLYKTYCSACHAPDGKGANNGQFPPLANSEWVNGKPERFIQIVLHGLQGPIHVTGKKYNLVMPPHGAAFTDKQIADVITYVRSAFGNKGSAVTVPDVLAQREASKDRTMMWQSTDLLKKHPIPNYGGGETAKKKDKPGKIHDLLSYIHHGKFKKLKDLRATKPKNVEEEKDGLISLAHADKKDHFGLVWEGWLDVPKNGNYTFFYDTDDGGAVTVNGKQIITRDRVGGKGKPSKGKIKLKKGRAEIKIEYFEFNGEEFTSLYWSGPGFKHQRLSESKQKSQGPPPSIPIVPPVNEAVMYRNFIAGSDARGIGVGYFEGVNLCFSADSMSLDMLWTGKFMDGGRHWVNRGQGYQPPAGEQLVTVNRGLAFTFLESQTEAWHSKPLPDFAPRFRGYQLNKKQQPTFLYQFGELSFRDEVLPSSEKKQFTRTITIEVPESAKSDKTLYFRALNKLPITSTSPRDFIAGKDFSVSVPTSTYPPFVRDKELIVPIPLDDGNQTITLTYTWK